MSSPDTIYNRIHRIVCARLGRTAAEVTAGTSLTAKLGATTADMLDILGEIDRDLDSDLLSYPPDDIDSCAALLIAVDRTRRTRLTEARIAYSIHVQTGDRDGAADALDLIARLTDRPGRAA